MSFDLVIIGGTGDLAWRKLMPALFQAFRHGKLPPNGRILAVGRDDHSRESYRDWLHERFSDVGSEKRPDDEEFVRFAELDAPATSRRQVCRLNHFGAERRARS